MGCRRARRLSTRARLPIDLCSSCVVAGGKDALPGSFEAHPVPVHSHSLYSFSHGNKQRRLMGMARIASILWHDVVAMARATGERLVVARCAAIGLGHAGLAGVGGGRRLGAGWRVAWLSQRGHFRRRSWRQKAITQRMTRHSNLIAAEGQHSSLFAAGEGNILNIHLEEAMEGGGGTVASVVAGAAGVASRLSSQTWRSCDVRRGFGRCDRTHMHSPSVALQAASHLWHL